MNASIHTPKNKAYSLYRLLNTFDWHHIHGWPEHKFPHVSLKYEYVWLWNDSQTYGVYTEFGNLGPRFEYPSQEKEIIEYLLAVRWQEQPKDTTL